MSLASSMWPTAETSRLRIDLVAGSAAPAGGNETVRGKEEPYVRFGLLEWWYIVSPQYVRYLYVYLQ
jgi:hypothetical protein